MATSDEMPVLLRGELSVLGFSALHLAAAVSILHHALSMMQSRSMRRDMQFLYFMLAYTLGAGWIHITCSNI
jgi:hypothetical protein